MQSTGEGATKHDEERRTKKVTRVHRLPVLQHRVVAFHTLDDYPLAESHKQ